MTKAMHTLIIGQPGSGKTYLTDAWKKSGYSVFDGDRIDIARWVDAEGKSVTFPDGASTEWLSTHRYLWDRERVERFLDTHPDAVMLGMSDNIFECLDLFDRHFYLDASPELLIERLQAADRTNRMGKSKEQRELVARAAEKVAARAKKFGCRFLDATQSPEKIWRVINSEA